MQDMKHCCVYRVTIFVFYCFDSYIYYLISIVPMNVIIGVGVGVGVGDGIGVGDDVGIVVGIRLGARMRLCVGIGVG